MFIAPTQGTWRANDGTLIEQGYAERRGLSLRPPQRVFYWGWVVVTVEQLKRLPQNQNANAIRSSAHV